MSKDLIVKIFEGQEIYFKNENGQPMVRIDEVAKFCGWIRIANSGNEVIRWSTINGYLKELSCQEVGTGEYIPEYIMYPLIGKAKNKRATAFMMWVGQIMVELRTKGVVILDHAEVEAIDFEKKFGTYRIRRTFRESNNVIDDYNQFVELSKAEGKAKRLNSKDRVKLSNIIVDTIENRIKDNMLELKPSEILQLQELVSEIKTDVIKLSNGGNGGQKAAQTKKIKQLEQQIEELRPPSLDEYVEINYHPFSVNSRLDAVLDAKGRPIIVGTPAYNSWKNNFPTFTIPSLKQLGVDKNKKIQLSIKFVGKEGIDTDNVIKTMQDVLFNFKYQMDDYNIKIGEVDRVGTVDNFKDGKTYIHIKNVEEENVA